MTKRKRAAQAAAAAAKKPRALEPPHVYEFVRLMMMGADDDTDHCCCHTAPPPCRPVVDLATKRAQLLEGVGWEALRFSLLPESVAWPEFHRDAGLEPNSHQERIYASTSAQHRGAPRILVVAHARGWDRARLHDARVAAYAWAVFVEGGLEVVRAVAAEWRPAAAKGLITSAPDVGRLGEATGVPDAYASAIVWFLCRVAFDVYKLASVTTERSAPCSKLWSTDYRRKAKDRRLCARLELLYRTLGFDFVPVDLERRSTSYGYRPVMYRGSERLARSIPELRRQVVAGV